MNVKILIDRITYRFYDMKKDSFLYFGLFFISGILCSALLLYAFSPDSVVYHQKPGQSSQYFPYTRNLQVRDDFAAITKEDLMSYVTLKSEGATEKTKKSNGILH